MLRRQSRVALLFYVICLKTGHEVTRRRACTNYGNATLAGLADQSFVRLQAVLNAAARLITLH